MRTPKRGSKPRTSKTVSFPVPTAGLISNRNLAMPTQQGQMPGAAILSNWFPKPQSVVMRRGLVRRATLPDGKAVRSMFSYSVGVEQQLFAASDDGVWDVSSVPDPDDPGTSVLSGTTSGDWHVVQFSTAGGTFLVGVNGEDDAFLYDGSTFGATSITFPAPVTLTTADLCYVWSYKQRLYFVEKDSLNVWYLPVDQIGGELTLLPLGGVFNRGGSIMWGQTWSLDQGGDGGLSEQVVFVTSTGEVAVYQGLSPDDANTWNKVGVYRIGAPLGPRAFIRAGGDLVIATTIGFIPLGNAIQRDYAALGLIAISQPVVDEWRNAILSRGQSEWICELWGEGSMTIVAPPQPPGYAPVVLVANSDSGAWCQFTGWSPTSIETWQGRLFLGTGDGRVQEAWVSGADDGVPYTADALLLFEDMGTPTQRKIARFARVTTRSTMDIDLRTAARWDWDTTMPAIPDSSILDAASVWDAAIWDEALWDNSGVLVVKGDWVGVGGSGFAASLAVRVTSGTVTALDVELVRMDLTYDMCDVVS